MFTGVKGLPGMHQTLGQIPSTENKKGKQKNKKPDVVDEK